MGADRAGRKLTAILAADVAGYSRLISADDEGTLGSLNRHRHELLDPCIAKHRGRIVKTTGDGLLVEFGSVVDAVRCAVEVQAGMAVRNADLGSDKRLEFRIGINVGDVVEQDGDIFGDGVNIAARLEGIAEPGGICVSERVHEDAAGKIGSAFEDIGEHTLKNIERPVRVYRLRPKVTSRAPSSGRPARRLPDKPSIAVLPFNNISGDPEQEYFSDGITEDIITDLSKISGLHVVARNTVFTYKGKPMKVQQTAQELGVSFVLEGSVRKVGSRVRVTGQLIDGKGGGHLWADRYDRDLTDIFAIQDEITHTIVEQLKVKLLPEERTAIGRTPTENVEAYTYYLRGRQFSHVWTKSYLLLARRMFSKAAELDPQYARAYAGIADCDSALHAWHGADVSLDNILAMSGRALALDPSLAEAHASRGLALHVGGRPEEAIAEFDHALALDPNLYETNFFYARLCFTQGDFERAAKLFERAAEIRPDDYRSLVLLTPIYRSLGREADRQRSARHAVERAERELSLHPENSGPAHQGAVALAHLGERDRAREWAARALAFEPDDVFAQYNIACAYSVLGDLDEALDMLERVVPRCTPEQILWFKNDSDLDPVRSHPRYQKLLETIGSQRTPDSVN